MRLTFGGSVFRYVSYDVAGVTDISSGQVAGAVEESLFPNLYAMATAASAGSVGWDVPVGS